MIPWLLVAGDFTPLGGMDRANHALAQYLATLGREVHLVTHRASGDLARMPTVTVHRVWRPFNRHLLGAPLLSRAAVRVGRGLGYRHTHVLANGGNCRLGGANWVHYVHAAFTPSGAAAAARTKNLLTHQRDVAAEREAVQAARIVICNSRRTKHDVVERLGVAESAAHVVYYGSDPVRLALVDDAARRSARKEIGLSPDRPVVGFVGALGDRRKALDSVFDAWRQLCRQPDWDAQLVVIGTGAELPGWRRRVREADLADRILFLGFRADVPELLAAFDALVHPARYEAYGLAVHEAICRGIPALVSASAGVAEHYAGALDQLLITDPDDASEVGERLVLWRRNLDRFRDLTRPLSVELRGRTWDAMGAEITGLVERAA